MAHLLHVRNNNELAVRAAQYLNLNGQKDRPANPVVNSDPTISVRRITMEVSNPRDRWLSVHGRNNSTIAAIGEVLWVLAGRTDIDFLSKFVKRAINFSDDGKTWRAGYGERLYHNGQLESVVNRLAENKDTRQAYLTIYNPELDTDLGIQKQLGTKKTKDFVCNTTLYFSIKDNKLDLVVSNRSQDLIWGLCSINFIEFTILQEVLANILEVEVGTYTIFSNNLHYYINDLSVRQFDALNNTKDEEIKYADNNLEVDTGNINSVDELRQCMLTVTQAIERGAEYISIEDYLIQRHAILEKSLIPQMCYIACNHYNNRQIDASKILDSSLLSALKDSKIDSKELINI
ncbi:hypothetical protein [Ralstonia phage RP13]|nr:hypothetical protein [Ralstonia phage RP13]